MSLKEDDFIIVEDFVMDDELDIGEFEMDIIKEVPLLEDLEVTPSSEEQNFKSENYYGFNNVKVKAVESEEIEIVPSRDTQIKEGVFNKVTVQGDENLIPENIVKGKVIFGTEGTAQDNEWQKDMKSTYQMFYMNQNVIHAPSLDTSNVEDFYEMFCSCQKMVSIPLYDMGNAQEIGRMFTGCKELVDVGGFKDLGKGFTTKYQNDSDTLLYLGHSTKLTHESLMNIINNLYDLNITYNVANGGTLYRQGLQIGSTNLAKLSADEIAIATNKGWNVT